MSPNRHDPPWLGLGEPVTLDNCEREPIHLPGRVQPHGAIAVIDLADGRVVQLSENLPAILGSDEPADALLGRTLDELLGADVADDVRRLPRTGPPSVRPAALTTAGGTLMAQAFSPDERLLGLELEASAHALPDAVAVAAQASVAAGRLSVADSADAVAAQAAELLHALTGFDRVWAYRFEDDGHGVIVAEERSSDDLAPFLGLHFPESDIPAQARALYVTAGVRLIGDSGRSDVPLLPEVNPVTGERLDLSGTDLRGVSPIHVRYLRNMGARTSMSIPLVVDGRLWGLLSAHHYSGAHAVPMLLRSQCEVLGRLTSMQIAAAQRLEETAQQAGIEHHLAELSAHLAAAANATDGLAEVPDALLALVNADGAILELADDSRRTVGAVPSAPDLQRILDAVAKAGDDTVVTDHLADLDPALADLSGIASGLLAVRLSQRHAHWVIWLRGEHVEHVTWANRDRGLVRRDPDGELELGERESFERWAEQVRGRSRPWDRPQVDAARSLRASIGAYGLRQAEQLQVRAAELARVNEELDAFAYSVAHDLRQPVRNIAIHSELVLEDAAERLVDDDTESLHAVLRLTSHMGALVDSLLEYAKLDYAAHQASRVELGAVIDEVRDLIGRGADDAVITYDDATVEADPDSLRHVLYNLVWNALKYNDGQPEIHVGTAPLSLVPGARARVDVPVGSEHDPDVIFVRDNGIGIATEHQETIFGLFRRLHPVGAYGGGSGAGLALCRRIVQRGGGTIWTESVQGEGSTFYFTLSAN
ncbi:MAG: GAF domain-containing protein [Solirubrobacteraceae bacterium]|nr:GAF domain-containing protein [Solirubrobacteraceae bacterium]